MVCTVRFGKGAVIRLGAQTLVVGQKNHPSSEPDCVSDTPPFPLTTSSPQLAPDKQLFYTKKVDSLSFKGVA